MILRLEKLKNKIYKVYNMRNFMMDIWVWTKETHSKPLKTIRFELDHFPTELECREIFKKDEDVEIYLNSIVDFTYTNLREYIK